MSERLERLEGIGNELKTLLGDWRDERGGAYEAVFKGYLVVKNGEELLREEERGSGGNNREV